MQELDKILGSLKLSELKELSLYLKSNKKKKVNSEIEKIIRRKSRARRLNINYRFKLDMISTFSLEDRMVLKKNKIRNMQDLIDADISSLEGIDAATEESLEWAQSFYDLSKVRMKKDARTKNYSS